MRIGICLPQIGPGSTADVVDDFIAAAERVGFDSLWVQEHLVRPVHPISGYGGRIDGAWPEQQRRLLAPFELLAFAAARTTTCAVGTSVAIAAYHHPVELAKRAATIDVLSRGRMQLGIGVGWCQDEFDMLGISLADRADITDEMLEALLACWGSNPVEFTGHHFRIPVSETSPKPWAGDRVRLVGGFPSTAGIRRTAKYCDVWQPFAMEPDEARRQLDEINCLAADDYGRGPLELSLRVSLSPEMPGLLGGGTPSSGRWAGDIDVLVANLTAALNVGCDELVLDTSFAAGQASADSWLAQPEYFRPLVELAHARRTRQSAG